MTHPEIRITSINKPPRILVYGKHKVGKTSFGGKCPKPIFIPTEEGQDVAEVASFPLSTSYEQFVGYLKWLITNDHEYRTAVIDSADWLEKLIFAKVCKDNMMNEINPPKSFGRGYMLAESFWNDILGLLTQLRNERKMMIVILAHAVVKKFEDPERDNYDRYQVDLQTRAAALISEYVDIIGYAAEKVVTNEKKEAFGAASIKAKSTGERVLNLNLSAAFEAGNRYGLPDQLPLEWSPLAEELKKKRAPQQANLAAVKAEKEAADLAKISGQLDAPKVDGGAIGEPK